MNKDINSRKNDACSCENEHEHHHNHDCCEHAHDHHDHDCCGHDHAHERHHDHDGCCCGCEHDEKLPVAQISIGAAILVAAIIAKRLLPMPVAIILFAVSYLLLGYDIILEAIRGLKNGRFLDENFLMSIASIGAFATGEYSEAAMVMLLYRIGEALQHSAVDKSRQSITALMDIRPDYANITKDGELVRVSPESVHIGDIITVKNGEKVPLDGIIRNGKTYMDTVALTGESVPRSVEVGSNVLSGFINSGAAVEIEVTKDYSNSTVAKILEITENARDRKSHSEQFITRFAKYYTPIVVAIAVLLAVVPPVMAGDFSKWFHRALIFLVISCPCALVISVPLGFFAGIGAASKKGILIKGSTYLESMSKLKTAVFDKTGTLTNGVFEVTKTSAENEDLLLDVAAHTEAYSNHPAAAPILAKYGKNIDRSRISNYREIAGMGISAEIDGKQALCGNIKLMNENHIYVPDTDGIGGTVVYAAYDNSYIGYIVISDTEKPDSMSAVSGLAAKGISTVMLTGDTKESAMQVSEHLGIDKTYYQLLPQDKVNRMEQIMRRTSGITVFVGDGINDAPVLAMSDVGIAMGGIGSDSAVEAADIVLMSDEPSKILDAVRISSKTMRIVKENIVFAISVKVLIMILGALGFAGMWAAIFADVGVALIAVVNSLRALK